MEWVEVFAVFALCHLVGDFLLQTNWQATHKRGGLGGDRVARRALASHIATYTLAFVPSLVWIGDELGAASLAVGALIAVPHWVQDDGRLIARYNERVKRLDVAAHPTSGLAVDQSFHLLALFGTALLVSGLS